MAMTAGVQRKTIFIAELRAQAAILRSLQEDPNYLKFSWLLGRCTHWHRWHDEMPEMPLQTNTRNHLHLVHARSVLNIPTSSFQVHKDHKFHQQVKDLFW